jgi:hypothetical protein
MILLADRLGSLRLSAMLFEHKRFARKRGAALAAALALCAIAVPAAATTTPTNIPNSMRDYAATPESRELLVRADDALNALTYTYYLFSGDTWSDSKGVYKVDCSGFMNRMVEDTNPTSYDYVADYRNTNRPSAEDYYYTFRSLPTSSTSHHWRRVTKAKDLRPGDILVWRYNDPSTSSTGHAVMVVSTPTRDTRWSNVYKIRVSDSARSGHSTDNRGSSGSGVGAGTMLIRYDSDTGAPYAYAWSLAGVWHKDVKFAAARPD